MEAETLGMTDRRDAVDGDADAAVTALFREHHLGLVRLALLIVGDQATAEDVVQDAFVRLHGRWHALRDQANALAYARSSVLNGSRSVLRRRLTWQRRRHQHDPPVWSAEYAALLGEDRHEVLVALRELPPRQREALVLRYYLELSEDEIARTMRISRGTVKSTTSRGLAALGRKLGEQR